MSRKRKPQKSSGSKLSDSDNESVGEDIFTDEISEFTESRNKIDLQDKADDSDGEEGIFALASDSDESDEEIGEWSKRLKQIKFQTKRDSKKIRPDVAEKSWGKKRTDFYGSGVRRKPQDAGTDEEDEWVMEEKEIERLQQRLDEDIDEEDFLVPGLSKARQDKASAELKVTRDLSEKDKEQYKKQLHPEAEPLREELNHCMEKVQALKERHGWMVDSRDTVYRLLGANIAFYLHLVETGQDTRGHPVLKRIIQWKKLAKIYDTVQDEDSKSDSEQETKQDGQDHPPPAKHARLKLEDSGESDDVQEEEDDMGSDQRARPVTYEIEKNKPQKKSVPNNPRVKHREKFRKAKIRRKGKIRDYRPEVTKYQGEISGIRTGITRSIRLA